uniref:Uncharacterized protein n=1 Tax=Arundo donax TaxID=35708 RepID=A0A0A8ZF12_ARUDO
MNSRVPMATQSWAQLHKIFLDRCPGACCLQRKRLCSLHARSCQAGSVTWERRSSKQQLGNSMGGWRPFIHC